MTTLYRAITAAGIETDNHESNLYFPATEESRAILDRFPRQKANATTFHSPGTPGYWFDVSYAYDPHWEKGDSALSKARLIDNLDGAMLRTAATQAKE